MKRRKLRIKFVKAVTWLAACLFVLAGGCMDGENILIPTIVAAVCGGWLVLVCIANTDNGGSCNG